MTKIAFIGSGVLAQHIAHYITNAPGFSIAGFYDDFKKAGQVTTHGNILGPIDQIRSDFETGIFDQLIIGIGYNHLRLRKEIFDHFSKKIPFTTYIHPTCYVDQSCIIGSGVIALPGSVFDMHVTVADNVFFNIGCNIAHDSRIDSHNFFGPAVKLAGFVQIDQECFIGINTTIIDNVAICAGTKTGGGTVITKSISQPGLYVGVPSKLINKTNE